MLLPSENACPSICSSLAFFFLLFLKQTISKECGAGNVQLPFLMTILCYVSGRLDPTQFFYNLVVVFDQVPDLYSLRRAIEQQANEDGLCTDGSEYNISDIEILDFRINSWVNLESRSQLYSGCFLTAIRDLATSSCAGSVDTTSRTSMQRVLGFAVNAQRMFEALDIDGEGLLRLKGFLRVLRHDVDYAVDAMGFLDEDAAGVVTFQQFVQKFHDSANNAFFKSLKSRIENAGRDIADPCDDLPPVEEHAHTAGGDVPMKSAMGGLKSPGLSRSGAVSPQVAGGGGGGGGGDSNGQQATRDNDQDSSDQRAMSPTNSDHRAQVDDLLSVADTAMSTRGRRKAAASGRGGPVPSSLPTHSVASGLLSKNSSSRVSPQGSSPPLSPHSTFGASAGDASVSAGSLRKVSTTLGLGGGRSSRTSAGSPSGASHKQ